MRRLHNFSSAICWQGKCRLSVISSAQNGIKGHLPTDLFPRTQIMHPSFRVVLAVIAALTASVIVSADSQCTAPGDYCTMGKRQCCPGFHCVPELFINTEDGKETESTIYVCDIEA
ncbi:hypothetical protein BDR07DRAFT_1398304 [Suillus spraguei]|nr:hypothetical protein BDR07DRAFT_1398304 [Suillus spraguei]